MNYEQLKEKALVDWRNFSNPDTARILIGTGTCGLAAGAGDLIDIIKDYVRKRHVDAQVCDTGCLGLCYAEPLVELRKPGAPAILFGRLNPENITECLENYFENNKWDDPNALAIMEGDSINSIPYFRDLPMIRGQVRIASRNFGIINPENINHYIARDGYAGLAKSLKLSHEDVITEVKASGLRGRGGAGFPTGIKWEFCRNAPGNKKYMICNGDEGDPGAFMDRSVLESDPHAVIEGMTIAAYAIGADEGYIYVRAEYPLAIKRLEKAIKDALDMNLVGKSILGSKFSFDIHIKKGAGAFVCGEETALIASIEGKRGMPKSRPPFPAQSGLFNKPSNINNVETLANIPFILRNGSSEFAENGTEKSRGTKTFALTGRITRTGLIEVPLGITLREIIFDIGGGIPDGKKFKAVQTGGPSGGCIPCDLLDLPVDYEKLAEAGAIMGSGGMVVMDESTCMVDIARYFISFTQSESCGKCVPCRLGTRQMMLILDSITRGDAKVDDINLLIELGETIRLGSLCGLGQTAPNPVLTTIKYYKDEYEQHIINRICPAGSCSNLLTYEIDKKKCIGCTACAKACPVDAISGKPKEVHAIDQEECTRCGSCFDVCKFEAVKKS